VLEILGSAEKLSPFGFFVRAILVGFGIYLLGRYLPRRAGGPFSAYDFAFFWMMGGLAASPLYEAKIGFAPTAAAVITVYSLHYLLSTAATKSRTFAKLLMGEPRVLVANGKVIRANMKQSLLPLEILMSELRTMNVSNIGEVEYAVMETSGHVSVIKKPGHSPATAKDLNVLVPAKPAPLIVVNEGRVVEESITRLGYSLSDFTDFFSRNCPYPISAVYIATLDKEGALYYSEL
jgi:uncharacterized membrane protein YcaP (DUF421 family)